MLSSILIVRFADCDMVMWYYPGLAIGHKYAWNTEAPPVFNGDDPKDDDIDNSNPAGVEKPFSEDYTREPEDDDDSDLRDSYRCGVRW